MRKQITASLLLIGLLTGCSLSDVGKAVEETKLNPITTKTDGNSQTTKTDGNSQTNNKADTEFTLVISGDVLSHDDHWKSARKEDGSFDYMPLFEAVQPLLAAGDLTLVNLETPVSGEKFGYRGFPKFNAPNNLAQTLKDVGVDLLITANNHALDNGMAGLNGTLNNLDRIGLFHTGAARSKSEAESPFILDINGIRTGFAASTIKLNMEVPEDYAVPLNREMDMRKQIRDLRTAGAEFVVFHIHWGKEYQEYPSPVQMELYRILEEEGVDVVIGSHPHRLQPMELKSIEFEGKPKQTVVIWSTANLSWGEPINKDYVNTGAVFRISIQRKDEEIRIKAVDYELVYNLKTKTVGGVNHFKIIPESAMELYKADFPVQYDKMAAEFNWAHQILNSTVAIDGPR